MKKLEAITKENMEGSLVTSITPGKKLGVYYFIVDYLVFFQWTNYLVWDLSYIEIVRQIVFPIFSSKSSNYKTKIKLIVKLCLQSALKCCESRLK